MYVITGTGLHDYVIKDCNTHFCVSLAALKSAMKEISHGGALHMTSNLWTAYLS